MSLSHEIYSQLFTRPPYPTADFSGKTIIVTGANAGLGKEAVKHFARLNAKRIIIAVRSITKGGTAKAEIEEEIKLATEVIEVWKVDYASYASCKEFAANVAKLDRVDAVVLNAGIATERFEIMEDNESQITVNVVSTTLLILLLLPIMRASAAKNPGVVPVISVVGSGVHAYTQFPERKTVNSLATLNNEKTAVMSDRYNTPLLLFLHLFFFHCGFTFVLKQCDQWALNISSRSYQVSKLLQLFAVREIAKKTTNKKPFVIVNTLNPGLCYSDLTRSAEGFTAVAMKVMRALLAWTAEEGGRTLVYATIAGPDSHGVFLSDSKIVK